MVCFCHSLHHIYLKLNFFLNLNYYLLLWDLLVLLCFTFCYHRFFDLKSKITSYSTYLSKIIYDQFYIFFLAFLLYVWLFSIKVIDRGFLELLGPFGFTSFIIIFLNYYLNFLQVIFYIIYYYLYYYFYNVICSFICVTFISYFFINVN